MSSFAPSSVPSFHPSEEGSIVSRSCLGDDEEVLNEYVSGFEFYYSILFDDDDDNSEDNEDLKQVMDQVQTSIIQDVASNMNCNISDDPNNILRRVLISEEEGDKISKKSNGNDVRSIMSQSNVVQDQGKNC